ncbi:hypothetical protein R3P38DRAFT_2772395 [Favolaschia claudopus]|uniref:Uncharacterized protein n=1 Tax=Favolaschia claudopus TaxID=2862362 RepID=A0AAW0C409_9AGAR
MELGRITHNLFSGAGHKIDELTKTLLKLKDNFDRCVSGQSVVKSAQILDKVTELENHNLLNQLRQASPRQSAQARAPLQAVFLSTFEGSGNLGQASLSRAMMADDANLVHAPFNKQFRELLLGPLVSVKQHLVGPIIIVLDALDECSDDSRNDISNLSFRNNPAIGEFDLNIVNDTHEDISNESSVQFRPPENLSPCQVIRKFVHLWATTALRFVEGEKSYGWSTRLENLLKRPEIGGNLDELYTMALQGDADWDTKEFREPATTI